jgi:ACR3 family arsenite efflux pump ArsB
LAALSVILPILMEGVIAHHGGETFMAAYLRSLTPFITLASMASSFIAAAAVLSFERSRPSSVSIAFGLATLVVFAVELSLSIYLFSARALAGTAQTLSEIYALIGLVPFGLACTMFTLAAIVSQGHELAGK